MPFSSGILLGRYQIVAHLGAGGMGEVYKAHDNRLGREVAIKALPPDQFANPERKQRFFREARAASALNHPNIITIHDIGNEDGADFLVMEYVPGKSLEELIPRHGMKLKDVLKYAVQIADALAAAHAAGIVHRDLKPGNVMVSESGLVKVLDFGLAKLAEDPAAEQEETTRTLGFQTQEGLIAGTAPYMSPEQAEGKRLDPRSDIFSFGAMLYEMVTGRQAFHGDTSMSTLAAVLRDEPKPASELTGGLPKDLERIISRCLRKDPERRFQDMADLKILLLDLKEESDSGALTAGDIVKRRSGSGLRGWRPLWVVLAVAAVSLAVGWFWFSRSPVAEQETALIPLPLTTYPGWERAPSFSPDGNQVAFEWAQTGSTNSDIYIKQIGVEEPFRLTDDPNPETNPAWSPDGGYIAFGRLLPEHRIAYIVKPQRGGPERMVAEFDASGGAGVPVPPANCAWTPDSKRLVVVGRSGAGEPAALVLVSVETGEARKLTNPPSRSASDTDPAVSPDGRTLVFTRRLWEFRSELYRLALTSDFTPRGEPEQFALEYPWSEAPAWTADGRHIVFVSGSLYGNLSLWRMDAFRSERPQRLAFARERVHGPAVSRQRNRLAYSVALGDQNIWRVETSDSSAKPREKAKFIASTRADGEPAYSPDGKRIAFASDRSGPQEIWVCSRDGSNPVQLTSLGQPFTNRPRWSPDGRWITFYSTPDGSNVEVYVIASEGGVPKRLTSNPARDTNPNWSADGKWIYFQSDRTGRQQIWKTPAGGGEAKPVGELLGGQAVESPDGKFLYVDKGWPTEYSVWRVPVAGGRETKVIDSLHPSGGWIVTEKGIYFVSKADDRGVSFIRFKDLATGSVRTIAPIEGPVFWGLTVSPDRREFLYAQFDEAGSDLMLVENFR